MTLPPLTARQAEILLFIKEFVRLRGYMPSIRDIGQEFGITSPNGVMWHLKAMKQKGYITSDPHRARAMRLTGADPRDELLAECAAALAESNPELAGRINTTIGRT